MALTWLNRWICTPRSVCWEVIWQFSRDTNTIAQMSKWMQIVIVVLKSGFSFAVEGAVAFILCIAFTGGHPSFLLVLGWFHDPSQRSHGDGGTSSWLRISVCRCWLAASCMQEWGPFPSLPKTPLGEMGLSPTAVFNTETAVALWNTVAVQPVPREDHIHNDGIFMACLVRDEVTH